MQVFTPSVTYLGQAPHEEPQTLQLIENAGRTCYKSEDKITDSSATTFFKTVFSVGHMSVTDHSNIVVRSTCPASPTFHLFLYRFLVESGRASFFRVYQDGPTLYIAANLRAWMEHMVALFRAVEAGSTDFTLNEYTKACTEYFTAHYPYVMERFIDRLDQDKFYGMLSYLATLEPRYTFTTVDADEQMALLYSAGFDLPVFVFRVVTDMGIAREFMRHDTLGASPCPFGISQESTRYVNYMKKVGIQFKQTAFEASDLFEQAEDRYNDLVDNKIAQPQFARDILPMALRTEFVASGRWSAGAATPFDLSSGWCHFLRQRHRGAHPDIMSLADGIHEVFSGLGLDYNQE